MKIAVVTGTSRRLGKAITEHLKNNGYFVYKITRSKGKFEKNTKEITISEYNSKSAIEASEIILEENNKIDLIINNASAFWTDNDDLNKFGKTIRWISGDFFYKKLPKIAVLTSYHGFSKGAELKVYLRKDNDARLPFAVGEFQFTFLKYVFIIPTFDDDEYDFTEKDNYEYFWSFFKFYHHEKNWDYQCFSNSEAKDFVFNMLLDVKPNDHQKLSDA